MISSFKTHAPKNYKLLTERINKIDDLEKLDDLKKSFKTNYDRYFKEFQDGDFDKYWKDLSKYRNRIAHNGIFEDSDYDKVRDNCARINKIINKASANIAPVEDESEADNIANEIIEIMASEKNDDDESVRDFNEEYFSEIFEDDLLGYLHQSEEYFKKIGGFVGRNKLGKHLMTKGFSYKSYNEVLDRLIEKGVVELYQAELSQGSHDTHAPAIRLNLGFAES